MLSTLSCHLWTSYTYSQYQYSCLILCLLWLMFITIQTDKLLTLYTLSLIPYLKYNIIKIDCAAPSVIKLDAITFQVWSRVPMTPFCWDFCELVNLIMTVLTSCWSTTTQSEPAMRMWLVTYLPTLWNKSITAVVLLFCHTETVRAEESCTLILVCFATSFDHMQCAKGACGVVESVVCLCVNCVKLWMDFDDIFWGQQLLWLFLEMIH